MFSYLAKKIIKAIVIIGVFPMSKNITSHNQSGGIIGEKVEIHHADKVTIGAGESAPIPPKESWTDVAKKVAVIVGLLGSVLAVLQQLGMLSVTQKVVPAPHSQSSGPEKATKVAPQNIALPEKAVTAPPVERPNANVPAVKPHSPVSGGKMSKEEPKPNVTNITSYNQHSGITAHTVNIGQQRRDIQPELKEEIIQRIPRDKKVLVLAVPGDEPMRFAAQIRDFLVASGYETTGVMTLMVSNPVVGIHIDVSPDDSRRITIGSAP